jgi:putative transposase
MDPTSLTAPVSVHSPERWAHLRFSVVGPLLASPPSRGQLHGRLRALADQAWRHPSSGEWV